MGFDVTFHPVSKEDLKRFLVDVVEDPKLIGARLNELSKDENARRDIRAGIYDRFPDWLSEFEEGGDLTFEGTFAFAAAALAGYRHPYWYARGSAVAFLLETAPHLGGFFVPLGRQFKGAIAKLPDYSGGLISQNYTASGFVEPQRLPDLKKELVALAASKKLYQVFDEQGYDAVSRAIDYALPKGLGLMEATDLVVPISGETFTEPANMRSHFQNKLEP